MFDGEFFQTHLEVLKPKDVQDADGLEVVSASDAVVELADDPVETLGVKCHGHGVSGVDRLQSGEEIKQHTLCFLKSGVLNLVRIKTHNS